MDFSKPPLSTIVEILRTNGLRILIIFIAAVIALRITTFLVHGIVKALLDREATEGTAQELSAVEVQKRMDTLDELGARVIRFFVIVIAGIMILGALDLDVGPAIAGLGIVGIAVGFGAQSLVKDYLNGALILAENQYSKGDVVTIAGVSGAVEDFSLRRTTLRDLDGTVHSVPNSAVIVASNRTRTWARINQNVTVAFGTDVDKVIQIVDDLGKSIAADPIWKRRILEPPRVDRVESIDEHGITLKILGTVRASEQWAAGGEFRRLLLETFTKNGIQLPGPQQVFVPPPDPGGPSATSATRATSATGAAKPLGKAPSQEELADE